MMNRTCSTHRAMRYLYNILDYLGHRVIDEKAIIKCI